jgi:glycosyltransferase involved in cell wall biosynthesis
VFVLDQKTPAITVVIPTFNRPQLLRRAVESAQRQTFEDFEIIVVIDGVDPASREALEQIQDPRLRYVELSEKVGGSEARNIGARSARGDWIALLDDDDEWLADKLEKQFAVCGEPKQSGVLVTSRYICQAPGYADVVRPRRLPRTGEPVSEFMFDYLCYFQTSTFLCSRELFLRIPYDPNLAFFQDIDWFLRLSMDNAFRLLVIDEPLSIYHVPAGRKSITTNLNWKARLEWGRERRHLLSGKAYSRFIIGTCAARAAEDGAGWSGFFTLLKDAVLVGSASPYLVALLCGAYFLPPQRRKQLRDYLFFTRAGKQPGQPTGRAS